MTRLVVSLLSAVALVFVLRAEPFVEVELDLRALWAGSTEG